VFIGVSKFWLKKGIYGGQDELKPLVDLSQKVIRKY
jgi:hypothetical protein